MTPIRVRRHRTDRAHRHPLADAREATLRLDALTAVRGDALFDPLTVDLAPGTLLGIVGPNGAGKSSLLGAIAGTGVPRRGGALFGGASLHAMSSRRRAATVSLMTQDSTAPNELRAIDVVRIGARVAASRPASITARARAALETLDIEHLAERVCSTLSGGQRQLVQVARVLAQGAPVMLLDEPTSALDLGHQLTVMHALHEHAASGHIVIVTMHDLTQALRWTTHTALVARGTVTVGRPHDVLTPDVVRSVYGVEAEVFDSPSGAPTLSLVRPPGLSPMFPHAPGLRVVADAQPTP